MEFLERCQNTEEEFANRRNYLSNDISNLIQLARETTNKAFIKGLDVGCGNGELTEEIMEKTGIPFEGVTPAPPSSHTLKIIKGYADNLRYPDNSFDVVTLISVFEHIPSGKRLESLEEIYRVLSPKGILIVQMPNGNYPVELHSKLLFINYLPRFLQEKYHRVFCKGEIYFYPIRSGYFLKVAKRGGFDLIKTYKFNYPKNTIPEKVRWLYPAARLLKMGIFFLLIKP